MTVLNTFVICIPSSKTNLYISPYFVIVDEASSPEYTYMNITKGQNLILKCNVTLQHGDTVVWDTPNRGNIGYVTINIVNVTVRDEGLYTCTLYRKGGAVTTVETVYLSVLCKYTNCWLSILVLKLVVVKYIDPNLEHNYTKLRRLHAFSFEIRI